MRAAAALFPANVNVAAALSLAGIGPDRTQYEVWADPTVERNTHVVRAGDATPTAAVRCVAPWHGLRPCACTLQPCGLPVYPQVRVEADESSFEMTIRGVPSEDNPATGKLTPLSALATLRGLVATMRVGT